MDQDGFIRILIDPFDTTFKDYNDDPDNVLNKIMAECGIPDGGKELLIDGKTGRTIRTPLLVGWNEYMRAHFIAEDKFTASPLIAYYKGGKA
jgi:DNA-directed RNA polymerase beta subunit